MAHAAARRRGDPSNEADYREVAVVIVCEPLRGLFLSLSADLADHNDPLGLLVRDEAFEDIDEVSSIERVTANAHNCGLTKAHLCRLTHCLISQGPRSRDNADGTRQVDVARHDTNLALAWLDDARAVRSNQP